MAKDYFQDIVPSDSHDGGRSRKLKLPSDEGDNPQPTGRGIRNINIPPRARHPVADVRSAPGRPPRSSAEATPREPGRTRVWLWVLSGVCVLALALFLLLYFFRITNVSVVPQSQVVTFDNSSQFTAYPAATAPSGTLSYAVQSTIIEGSAEAPSSGTQHVETKASGSITVMNAFSAGAIRLVKNTRFESPAGLIFRVPADVTVPGKSPAGPGKVNVTVVAEAAGAQYNLAPQTKFTVPGLKSSSGEYANVYAISTASTTGGFIGDQPGIAAADLDVARAQIRASLQTKADAFLSALNSATTSLLVSRVTFADEPNTLEPNKAVGVHESAAVDAVVVPAAAFASSVGQTVAADVSEGSIALVPGAGYAASLNSPSAIWGADPLSFTLTGHALLVWKIDAKALAQALAGKSENAFQSIVRAFPGVASATTRIEPFWETSFPTNPAEIHISVDAPKTAQ